MYELAVGEVVFLFVWPFLIVLGVILMFRFGILGPPGGVGHWDTESH